MKESQMKQLFLIIYLALYSSVVLKAQDAGMVNDRYISSINDRSVRYIVEKSEKHARWLYRLLRIHTSSIMYNEDAKISIRIDHDKLLPKKAGLLMDFENNTDQLLFVDLGNSFFRKGNSASSFFLNSSTTTTTGGGFGWSFGTNTIGNMLGMRGPFVSGGSFVVSSKSTTVYADRIVAIAPHTKYSFPMKIFYDTKQEKPYRSDFKLGEKFNYPQPDKFEDSPWEVIISYANESDLDAMKRMRVAMYISEEMSVMNSWKNSIEDESEQSPIHYFYLVDD